MRIDRPRAMFTFTDKDGKTRHRLYFAQYLMLRLMDVLGTGEPVPKEVAGISLITATGMMRKHLAADLILHNLADRTVDRSTGVTNASLTRDGKALIRSQDTEVLLPKTAAQRREFHEKMRAIDLLAHQRGRARIAKAHVRPLATGRRTAAA